jgi:hypothetical protein
MTVSTIAGYAGPYLPNGVTTAFPFTFNVGSAAEVQVFLDDAEVSTGFTVTINTDQASNPGGTVTFASAPEGTSLVIASDPDFTQEIAFTNSGPFLASAHDEVADQAARKAIALKRESDRAFKVPVGSVAPSFEEMAETFQGTPGGDGSLIPKFTIIALQAGGVGIDIPSDIEIVQTVGYDATDVGSAVYTYDAAVDSDYVTAHPRASFLAEDGRGFRLSWEQDLTPQIFGAVGDGVTDDTDAFVALAAIYNEIGQPAHIPDAGAPYLVQADSVAFVPPASYNAANRRPPAITSDPSAIIEAASGGAYLIKLGALDSDYSGYLRSGEYDLPELHDGGFAFTKGVLYVPFFLDCRFDHRIVCTVSQKGAQFGDTAAPAASAGVKGNRDYEWDFHAYARTVQSITNAVNPIVTFATSHGLWPSSGNRVVCLDFTGTLGSWSAINGVGVDCTVLSATQIQLKNVDTTAYGVLPGTTTAYLNFPSSRIPKQIAGVTNANPAVITTTTAHLLTSGDTVDIAEIFGMPTLIGQYTATVLSATTFSIPVNTTSTSTWGTWTSSGPGWAMQWVAPASCDIAEYHDNATDIDDSELYSRHFRIHQYHNPSTCGYDGKHQAAHFYNFPEAGEMLCAYYLGGDNNCVQIQCDGPFRYVFWALGPRNSSTQCSTNIRIAARDQYGCLVRTESGGGWASYADRLKADTSGHEIFSEHVGLGTFACRDTIAVNVAFPLYEAGSGNRAASVRFIGSSGVITQNFQVSGVTRSSAGVYVVAFTRAVPLESNMLVGAGTTNAVIAENEGYGSRSVFQRQITCQVAGVATDPGHVNLEWRFP